ncbi:hypothetical protein [Nitratifractor sp.]
MTIREECCGGKEKEYIGKKEGRSKASETERAEEKKVDLRFLYRNDYEHVIDSGLFPWKQPA